MRMSNETLEEMVVDIKVYVEELKRGHDIDKFEADLIKRMDEGVYDDDNFAESCREEGVEYGE